MIPKRKNRFISFLCIFIPGAAEMHVGFMKMGASLMALFFAALTIPTVFNFGELSVALGFLLWFYGFFHGININAATNEELLEAEDYYIWQELISNKNAVTEKKNKKILAVCVIIGGCILLLNSVESIVISFIPDEIWEEIGLYVSFVPGIVLSLFIIILGIKLVRTKKEEISAAETE